MIRLIDKLFRIIVALTVGNLAMFFLILCALLLWDKRFIETKIDDYFWKENKQWK